MITRQMPTKASNVHGSADEINNNNSLSFSFYTIYYDIGLQRNALTWNIALIVVLPISAWLKMDYNVWR